MPKSETQIQKDIIEYLEELQYNKKKCYVIRVNSGYAIMAGRVIKLAPEGTPDIIVCYKGKFIGLEVKSSTGKQRVKQKEAQDFIESAKGQYYIVRSLQAVKKIIK